MRHVILLFATSLALALMISGASADDRTVCRRNSDNNRAAIAACTRLIEKNPNDAAAYKHRGIALVVEGAYDRAIVDLTKVITFDSRDATAYFQRALCYDSLNDGARAFADFTQVIELAPRDIIEFSFAYYHRANAHDRKGDTDKAIADYTRAIAISPKSAILYTGRGYVYLGKAASTLPSLTSARRSNSIPRMVRR